jgi:V-type H+-transporting ATPase subunit D
MGRVMQLAAFSLAEVTFATGSISYQIQEGVKTASFKVKTKSDNISGVVIPTFAPDRAGSGENAGNGTSDQSSRDDEV